MDAIPMSWKRVVFHIVAYIALFISVLLRASPAEPADLTTLSIEELMEIRIAVVYGASKFDQKVTDAPSSVSVVTENDIKKYGHRTLADILRSLPGFYFTYDLAYEYIGVRGFGRFGDLNTRVLLLVDGHRLNDSIFGQAYLGTDFILDVDLIKRIEVIRGPGSALYGSNAFFAAINVITRRGSDMKGAEVSGEAATNDTFKGRASYGTLLLKDTEFLISSTVSQRRGEDFYFPEYDDPSTNNGIAEKRDYERGSNAFASMSYGPFTLQAACSTRKKGVSTAYYETRFNDSRTYLIDSLGYIDLKFEKTLGTGMDVMARIFYDSYTFNGVYPYPDVVNEDKAWGRSLGGEVKISRSVFFRQRLTGGLELKNNFRLDQKNYDRDPYDLHLDDRRSSVEWAAYAQDEVRISDALLLNLGIRYDHYKSFGGTLNPRLAAIWHPFKETTLKLIYGTAFRAPSTYEAYYNDGLLTIKPNPNLKPETIKTFEFALEQYLGKQFRMSVSAFHYRVDDLIALETDPSDDLFVFQNADSMKAMGMELEMEYLWASGPRVRASYSFQETQNLKEIGTTSNSPKHLAKLNMDLPIFRDKLFTGFEIQYTGPRKTFSGDTADGYFVANITMLGSDLLKGLDISLSVYNIFNNRYSDPASPELGVIDKIRQEGRNARFKVVMAF